MPELPEVEALRGFLAGACVGKFVARAELASFASLKTYDPPLSALGGLEVEDVQRRGKFIGICIGGLWLVFLPLTLIPRSLRDAAYNLLARVRYRLFGRFDTCPLPPPEVRARFLP